MTSLDPLRRLIDAVRAVCPDALIDFGPCLSSGDPTVHVLREPGQYPPGLVVIYCDDCSHRQYPEGYYVVRFWEVRFETAVAQVVEYIQTGKVP